jgi:hypothetical protein
MMTLQELEKKHYQKIDAERKVSFWNYRYHSAERNARKYPFSERRKKYALYAEARLDFWTLRLEALKRELGK